MTTIAMFQISVAHSWFCGALWEWWKTSQTQPVTFCGRCDYETSVKSMRTQWPLNYPI